MQSSWMSLPFTRVRKRLFLKGNVPAWRTRVTRHEIIPFKALCFILA